MQFNMLQVIHAVKEKPPVFAGEQVQGADVCTFRIGTNVPMRYMK